MDDDILLDNQVVLKTMEFLKYANQDIAIAGAMLDQRQPKYQYEGGANYSGLKSRHKPINMFFNLSLSEKLNKLSKDFQFDYEGLWYFLFPKEAIEKVGLLLPLFLICDDVDYCIRLQNNGYQLLSIPGIAVWHEPFYMKTKDEAYYYGIRNCFIISEIHFSKFLYINSLFILKRFLALISSQDYKAASLCIRAIEDILKGPGFFKDLHEEKNFTDLKNMKNINIEEVYHKKFTLKKINYKSLQKVNLDKVKEVSFLSKVIGKMVNSRILLNHLMPKFMLRKLSESKKNVIFKRKYFINDRLIFISLGHRNVVYLMPDGFVLIRDISHSHFYRLSFKMISLLVKLFFKIPSLKKAWKKEFPYLVSQEYWQKKFTS